MPQASFQAYRESLAAGYAQDNITSGRWPKEGALERAYEDLDQSLPQGLDTPDHYIYEIISESTGAVVGVIWFASVAKHGIRSAFVYDVEIKAECRRQGYARAAFEALEILVRTLGLPSIGLNVFNHNPGAQALYESLGYEVTNINMLKKL